jgi:hypothetical protein
MRNTYTFLIIIILALLAYILYRYYFGGHPSLPSRANFSFPDIGSALDSLFQGIGKAISGR